MKKLYLLFILIALTGCSRPEPTENVTAVLDPFMKQIEARYETQYKELKDSRDKLDADYKALLSENMNLQKQVSDALIKAQAAESESANNKALYVQLSSQAAQTQSTLLNMTNERALFEQKYVISQTEVTRLQMDSLARQREFDNLYAKITRVNNRADPTIDDQTAAEKTAFYLLWDKWWKVEIETE